MLALWKPLASLTFPIWGTVAAVGLIILFNSEAATTLIVVIGVLLTALSSAPIIKSAQLGSVAKVLLTCLYFGASALVVFVLGLFLLCMHQCN